MNWTLLAVSAAVFFGLRWFVGVGFLWALLAAAAVYFGWVAWNGPKGSDNPAAPA